MQTQKEEITVWPNSLSVRHKREITPSSSAPFGRRPFVRSDFERRTRVRPQHTVRLRPPPAGRLPPPRRRRRRRRCRRRCHAAPARRPADVAGASPYRPHRPPAPVGRLPPTCRHRRATAAPCRYHRACGAPAATPHALTPHAATALAAAAAARRRPAPATAARRPPAPAHLPPPPSHAAAAARHPLTPARSLAPTPHAAHPRLRGRACLPPLPASHSPSRAINGSVSGTNGAYKQLLRHVVGGWR